MRKIRSEKETDPAGQGELPADGLHGGLAYRKVRQGVDGLAVFAAVVREQVMDGRGDVQAETPDGNAEREAGVGRKGEPVVQKNTFVINGFPGSGLVGSPANGFFPDQITRRDAGKPFEPAEQEEKESKL